MGINVTEMPLLNGTWGKRHGKRRTGEEGPFYGQRMKGLDVFAMSALPRLTLEARYAQMGRSGDRMPCIHIATIALGT